MFKIIGKNLIRSLLMSAIVIIPTIALTACGAEALVHGLGFLSDTSLTYYIMSAVFAGIAAFITLAVIYFKSDDWGVDFLNIRCDGDNGYYKAIWVYLGLLLHLVLACGMILIMIFCRDALTVKVQENSNWVMVCCVLTSIAAMQILYFADTFIIYAAKYTCFYCGHIFSIAVDGIKSVVQSDYTQYKTETNRKQVGSLYSGNTEVAKVYGDVESNYSRDVHTVKKTYNCHCTACQKKMEQTETDSTYGKWK